MVAPLLIGAAIGAGAGILKQQEQERQFQEQARLAATQTSVSSFSQDIRPGELGGRPSLFQNVLQGSLAGAAVVGKNPSKFGGGDAAQAAQAAQGAQAAQAGAALTDGQPFDPNQPQSNQTFEDPNVLANARRSQFDLAGR